MAKKRVSAVLAAAALAGVLAASTQASPHAAAARCPKGTKAVIINNGLACLKVGAKCVARYEKTYNRHGYHCSRGKLVKRTKPKPPPPPPPKPVAVPGHYVGRTSQNEVFDFDVTADGKAVVNLATGQVNESCTPGASLSGGNIALPGQALAIDATGTFSYDASGIGTVGSDASHVTVTIEGHLSPGGVAAGNLQSDTSFVHEGTAYSCSSGLVSWTASRVG